MAVSADDELAQIREQRRAELQQQLEQQAAAQADAEIDAQAEMEQSQALDAAMKTVLTPEARSRLASLNLVNPEICTKVKTYLATLSSENKIQIPVTDDQLKQILAGLNLHKRETKIRRL